MKIKYYLAFDRRVSYGSPEHFFHFMWGYLLPLLHTIKTLTKPEVSHYLLVSCGPIMDSLSIEIMHLFDYNFSIVSDASNRKGQNQLIIPRWDIALLHSQLLNNNVDSNEYTIRMRENLIKHASIYNTLKHHNFESKLALVINETRLDILQKTNAIDTHKDLGTYANCYLLLARSSEPAFYAEQGKAEILGYGTSRRALLGIKDTEQKLKQKKLPIRSFEPGKYSLTEQIRVFQDCKGVIGIKGAEFANLMWMKPHSQVILIKPTCMNTPPVQRKLANILKLNYIEIEDSQGRYPTLKPEMIDVFLDYS